MTKGVGRGRGVEGRGGKGDTEPKVTLNRESSIMGELTSVHGILKTPFDNYIVVGDRE